MGNIIPIIPPAMDLWIMRDDGRSEEHTSELQSHSDLVCRLLLVHATPEIYTLSLHDALPICEHSAREQDGGNHRGAPRSVREATAGHRPGNESEAQDRDGVDGKHHPHHPARNGLVDNA